MTLPISTSTASCQICKEAVFVYTGGYADAKDLARRNGWFVADRLQSAGPDTWFCDRCVLRTCDTFPALLEAAEAALDYIEVFVEQDPNRPSGFSFLDRAQANSLRTAIAAARGDA